MGEIGAARSGVDQKLEPRRRRGAEKCQTFEHASVTPAPPRFKFVFDFLPLARKREAKIKRQTPAECKTSQPLVARLILRHNPRFASRRVVRWEIIWYGTPIARGGRRFRFYIGPRTHNKGRAARACDSPRVRPKRF